LVPLDLALFCSLGAIQDKSFRVSKVAGLRAVSGAAFRSLRMVPLSVSVRRRYRA